MNILKKMLPEKIKDKIKLKIMNQLQLVPRRQYNILNRVVSHGIENYLTYDFYSAKRRTLDYINKMHLSGFEYKYSESRTKPTLYASVYACMLLGLYNELDNISKSEKDAWAEYFNSYQCEDGFFRDPLLIGEEFEKGIEWGDGWGVRHLTAHIIIAYSRLNRTPKLKFKFLEPYYDLDYLEKWLNSFDFNKSVWTASNYIMNLATIMQYSRDKMNDINSGKAVEYILNWLTLNQNCKTGMWHHYELNSYKKLADAIRGAYHFYPLFVYDNKEIFFKSEIVENILRSQNNWGGFEDQEKPSGACEDIDAIEPLIRFTYNNKTEKVDYALKKSLIWILANQNEDGGFMFMLESPHHYGGHTLTSSNINESNMFATWFRTLCIAYIVEYLGIENDFNIGRFPGYEITL